MDAQLRCSGPKLRQDIMAEGHDRGKLLTSWQPGSRGSHREDEPFHALSDLPHLAMAHMTIVTIQSFQTRIN